MYIKEQETNKGHTKEKEQRTGEKRGDQRSVGRLIKDNNKGHTPTQGTKNDKPRIKEQRVGTSKGEQGTMEVYMNG